MPSELEERIKDLCTKALAAEGEDLETVLAELREALAEQSRRARALLEDLKRQTKPPE
jgi:hypothetical protein